MTPIQLPGGSKPYSVLAIHGYFIDQGQVRYLCPRPARLRGNDGDGVEPENGGLVVRPIEYITKGHGREVETEYSTERVPSLVLAHREHCATRRLVVEEEADQYGGYRIRYLTLVEDQGNLV